MKKKHWIILIIALVVIIAGLVLYFATRPTLYKAQQIDPRTLHASPAKHEILVGLWQKDGHVFYRFEADGTGRTWDVDDDLTEDEGTSFDWETYEEAFMMTHKMRFRGVVPRYYEFECLNAFDFRFHDTYTSYSLERVNPEVAFEPAEETEETVETIAVETVE